MIRFGLIGVGAWGQRYINTVARRSDCQIVAYARAHSGKDFALPGATPCDSWQTLLERHETGDFDGLIVATTPTSQAEIATAAFIAGIPCLVEKPLGTSRGSVDDLCNLAVGRSSCPPLIVNYVHLWAPAYRTLQDLVRQTDGGSKSVARIDAEGYGRGPFRGWSSLYDYGPHDVAMCLGLVGVTARFVLKDAQRTSNTDTGELFEAHFDLDETKVTIRVGNGGHDKRRRLAVTLKDKRVLLYDDLQPHPSKLLDSGQPVPISLMMPLDGVLTDFLGQIERWKRGTLSKDLAIAPLALSQRVSGILDTISAAIPSRN